jgi:hypothetical protein
MPGISSRTFLVLSLTVSALGMSQRTIPPASLQCSRDHLTSFQGQILEYRRGPQEVFVRVRTDEERTESFTLKWGVSEKAETWLLLRGQGFKADDWKQVEIVSGKLHDGMRIIVWSCDNGAKPVFDWRPKA